MFWLASFQNIAYFNRDDGAGARGRTDSSGDMAREMVAKAADDLHVRNLKVCSKTRLQIGL